MGLRGSWSRVHDGQADPDIPEARRILRSDEADKNHHRRKPRWPWICVAAATRQRRLEDGSSRIMMLNRQGNTICGHRTGDVGRGIRVQKNSDIQAGVEMELLTDHAPIVPIINSHRLDEIENPRLQRL